MDLNKLKKKVNVLKENIYRDRILNDINDFVSKIEEVRKNPVSRAIVDIPEEQIENLENIFTLLNDGRKGVVRSFIARHKKNRAEKYHKVLNTNISKSLN
ncbi:hypothetical protein [Pseudotamlana agarivorans]|uniref:hypothetical protein n=1 Tax=Pseudotamlana agarivorans TaxID=481183 RepID=UPI000831D454|nr:hypothetical protein [Tamlana agarivorans]